jgi:hypothetical protein
MTEPEFTEPVAEAPVAEPVMDAPVAEAPVEEPAEVAEPVADPVGNPDAPDVYDPRDHQPELAVADEQGAQDWATAVQAICRPELADFSKLHIDGVDFLAPEPEKAPGHANFHSGA